MDEITGTKAAIAAMESLGIDEKYISRHRLNLERLLTEPPAEKPAEKPEQETWSRPSRSYRLSPAVRFLQSRVVPAGCSRCGNAVSTPSYDPKALVCVSCARRVVGAAAYMLAGAGMVGAGLAGMAMYGTALL